MRRARRCGTRKQRWLRLRLFSLLALPRETSTLSLSLKYVSLRASSACREPNCALPLLLRLRPPSLHGSALAAQCAPHVAVTALAAFAIIFREPHPGGHDARNFRCRSPL